MIDSIRRARAIPRDKALQKVANQTQSKRPIFAVTWVLVLGTAKPAQGAGEALQVNDSFISLPERGLPWATISSLQEADKYKWLPN